MRERGEQRLSKGKVGVGESRQPQLTDTKPGRQSQLGISPTAGVHTVQKSVRPVTGLGLWEASAEANNHLHKHRGHDFCAHTEILGDLSPGHGKTSLLFFCYA